MFGHMAAIEKVVPEEIEQMYSRQIAQEVLRRTYSRKGPALVAVVVRMPMDCKMRLEGEEEEVEGCKILVVQGEMVHWEMPTIDLNSLSQTIY